LQIKHKLLSVWSRAACEVLRCSGLRNGTTQRFGTAAQEETASACADAAPSCFFAHSLFIIQFLRDLMHSERIVPRCISAAE